MVGRGSPEECLEKAGALGQEDMVAGYQLVELTARHDSSGKVRNPASPTSKP